MSATQKYVDRVLGFDRDSEIYKWIFNDQSLLWSEKIEKAGKYAEECLSESYSTRDALYMAKNYGILSITSIPPGIKEQFEIYMWSKEINTEKLAQ